MYRTSRQREDQLERGIDQVDQITGGNLECVRAEALFVSDAQRSDHLTADEIRAAVGKTVSKYGTSDLAALVAHEFGEHPDTAAGRMSWALCEVRTCFAGTYPTAA